MVANEEPKVLAYALRVRHSPIALLALLSAVGAHTLLWSALLLIRCFRRTPGDIPQSAMGILTICGWISLGLAAAAIGAGAVAWKRKRRGALELVGLGAAVLYWVLFITLQNSDLAERIIEA